MGYKDLGNNWNRKWLDDIKAMLKELYDGGGIASNSVGQNELKDGAVTQSKLANDSVDATKIKNSSLGNAKFADNSLNRRVLTNDFSYLGSFTNVDIDTLTKEGYAIVSFATDAPVGFINSGIVEIKNANGWIHQVFTELQNPTKKAYRVVRGGNIVKNWESVETKVELEKNSIGRDILKSNFLYNSTITSGTVNDLRSDGVYLLASKDIRDLPTGFTGSAILEVSSSGGWIHQTYSELQKPSKKAFRFLRDTTIGSWEYDVSKYPLTGKTVVNFGDSTIGNIEGSTSVSGVIASFTGAKTHNVGFGGCRMGKHAQYWDAFSFYNLMSEVIKDDTDSTKWKYQDESVTSASNGSWTSMPGYFPKHLEELKSIDFNNVDFITISYGTNDYTGGNKVDNKENKFDTTTFAGALRQGLSVFMKKYQNVSVLVCTPTYRMWFNEDKTFKEDSDTLDYEGTGTLIDYVEKTIEVSKEFKNPVLDCYFGMGVNKYNYSKALTYPDGVHHDLNGRKIFGEYIAKKLISM